MCVCVYIHTVFIKAYKRDIIKDRQPKHLLTFTKDLVA